MLLLLLLLMFVFIPITMRLFLLLFFSFCFGFGFGFDFGLLFLFAAVERFCFIPERGRSVPGCPVRERHGAAVLCFLPAFSVIGPARRGVRPCCLPKAQLFCAVGRPDAFS